MRFLEYLITELEDKEKSREFGPLFPAQLRILIQRAMQRNEARTASKPDNKVDHGSFVWERIEGNSVDKTSTYRMRTPNGWIVKYVSHTGDYSNEANALCEVNDPQHAWNP